MKVELNEINTSTRAAKILSEHSQDGHLPWSQIILAMEKYADFRSWLAMGGFRYFKENLWFHDDDPKNKITENELYDSYINFFETIK